MTVSKGDMIFAIDEERTLEVEGLWGSASKTVDFSARYTSTNLVDVHGNNVFGNRGFRFEDEGKVWRKSK